MADAVLSVEARLSNLISNEMRKVAADVVAANEKVGKSAVGATQQTARLNQSLGQANRVVGATALALGQAGAGFGGLGRVIGGATGALAAFSSGAGGMVIGVGIAAAAVGLLADQFTKAKQKIIDANEAIVKSEKEKQAKLQAGTKAIVAVELRAETAAVGDDPVKLMQIRHREELKALELTEGGKRRIMAAQARELEVLEAKLAKTRREQLEKDAAEILKTLNKLNGDLDMEQLGGIQDRYDREIAIIKHNNRTIMAEAKAHVIERIKAMKLPPEQEADHIARAEAAVEAPIMAKQEEQIGRVESSREIEQITRQHELIEASLQAKQGHIERERALLEEQARFELELARAKGEETRSIEARFATQRVQLYRSQNEQIAGAVGGLLTTMLGFSRRNKQTAALEAIINTAVGVTKAYAQGGVLGLLTGATVAAAGAVQLATINAQKFETGGFPVGRNALIQVNENGQEAVLNAGAVERVGRSTIDAMNRGEDIRPSRAREVNVQAPVSIVIHGNASPGTAVQLEDAGRRIVFDLVENLKKAQYMGLLKPGVV